MMWPSPILRRGVTTSIDVEALCHRRTAAGFRVCGMVDRRLVWFASHAFPLAAAAEAFATAFLVPALHAGRLLRVDDPVEATWLAEAARLIDASRESWYPDAPGLAALPHAEPHPPATGTALAFAGGVDCFHALIAGRDRIDALVAATGSDPSPGDGTRHPRGEQMLHMVAAEFGIEAVVVRTNLCRHPLVRRTPWPRARGGTIAALGPLLRDRFGALLVASAGVGEVPPPHGSATVRVETVGAATRFLDKLRRLVGEPLARRHLRVCENPGRGGRNCGGCAACVRTRLGLEACGAADAFTAFPRHRGTADAVDALPPPECSTTGFYRELLELGLPSATAGAVRRLLGRARETPPPPTVRRSTRRHLLAPSAFAHVFQPLVGSTVGYIRPLGNVGDELIELAMAQLLAEFGVRWACWQQGTNASFDALIFGGGGNMGTRYRNNHDLRSTALASGIPLTILPQSFTAAEDRPFARVYVRDRESLRLHPAGILAPDLALGLAWPAAPAPTRDLGIFLRCDQERRGRRPLWRRDPARVCRAPCDYLALAASHRRIITDRLHFAIAGLHAGRDVTLVANDYHKNRSMHATWLAALGCRFAESVAAAVSPGPGSGARAA